MGAACSDAEVIHDGEKIVHAPFRSQVSNVYGPIWAVRFDDVGAKSKENDHDHVEESSEHLVCGRAGWRSSTSWAGKMIDGIGTQ